MTDAPMLQRLARWHAAGWLRALDLAFARFMHELDPQASETLLLAGAWLAHLEGHGHTCLPLQALADAPLQWLGWPGAAEPELAPALAHWPRDAAQARTQWGGSVLVQVDPVSAHLAQCRAGPGANDNTPLVLHEGRLYLRRYWHHESRVAAEVRARSTHEPCADPATVRRLLDALFEGGGSGTAPGPDWQKVACALALRGRLTIITGGPGTGKTHTAARLLMLLLSLHPGPEPLRVALAAPTGKAAARLRQSIDQALRVLRASERAAALLPPQALAAPVAPALTLHALLGARPGTRRFARNAANPLALDLLLVDEASMVNLEMMAALLDALPRAALLVLLGDRDQLASVEAGAVLGELCQGAAAVGAAPVYDEATRAWVAAVSGQVLPAPRVEVGPAPDNAPAPSPQVVMLRESRRFAGRIGELAAAVNRGDAARARDCLRAEDGSQDPALAWWPAADATDMLPLAMRGRAGAEGGHLRYLELLANGPSDAANATAFDTWARQVLTAFEGFRVLCALREGPFGVQGQNAAIERALAEVGALVPHGEWYAGRPVMVTRNEPALRIFNGDVGVALHAPRQAGQGERALRVYFLAGEVLHSVAVGRLADVQTAFAITVHKSQGSEFEHVVLVLPATDSPLLTRELIYTGITRARSAFTLVAPHEPVLTAAIGRLTERASGLAARLRR